MNKGLSGVINRNPDIVGGLLVFSDTRVLVKSLFDALEAGDTIDDFLEGFPTVKREQVIAVLEQSKKDILAIA
ncbi:MAG: DUF433 domain-containing protein [Verrucomicrobia bacterium]|nr:DUF433 domain-containing protein [Verrucomicrobiota bacterium]MDA1066300.1 DUF433 domain-containing protein [Verrucomicrobiota bacterium]